MYPDTVRARSQAGRMHECPTRLPATQSCNQCHSALADFHTLPEQQWLVLRCPAACCARPMPTEEAHGNLAKSRTAPNQQRVA